MNKGSRKPPEAPQGKGPVKEAVLGAQGPDSEPGPTLPGQGGSQEASDLEEGVVARPR